MAAATLLIPVAWAAETAGSSTEQVARRYLAAIGQRDLDAQPFAENAIMRDLTADFRSQADAARAKKRDAR